MESDRSDSPKPPARSALLLLVVLALPIAAVLLFRGLSQTQRPPRPCFDHRPTGWVVPQFPSGPAPAGHVTLRNLRLRPLEASGIPGFSPGLRAAFHGQTLQIIDAKTKAPVWAGPMTATFTLETAGGVDTLKDSRGKILWTNAARRAHPDLLLRRGPDNQARLTGRDGATLWRGRLPVSAQSGEVSEVSPGQTMVSVAGLRVEGASGVFRVSDSAGKRLWSGHLPASPLIIAEDGPHFEVSGPGYSETGYDGIFRIRFASSVGTVTVADTKGRTLGTLPTEILRLHRTRLSAFQPPGDSWSDNEKTQDGLLNATGTLLLTYRDSAGHVVRRQDVQGDAYRDSAGRVVPPPGHAG